MALVLKRILHEAPDMSEIQAGMKHPLIVPVSEPYGFVQLTDSIWYIFLIRDERHDISSSAQVTTTEVSMVECSLNPRILLINREKVICYQLEFGK